jgi:hypothetical protein
MSAAVGVWKRTNGTLAAVLTMPDASGVIATVDCWAIAQVATNSNNSPVFFMLPPTLNRSGVPQLSPSEDKGYSRKVTSARERVKVTRVFSLLAPKVFPEPFGTLMLHLRLRHCNIAPSLKTNGLGFVFHSRAPFSAYAPA